MKSFKNENGYALFLTILLIFLVTTIGISLLTLSVNANKTTINERADQSFYYFAEAGINLEKSNITEVITKIDNNIKESFNHLTYEEQVELLSYYNNDFSAYYYSKMNDSFCDQFNGLYNSDSQPRKCNAKSNSYTSSFTLTPQYDQQPKVDTSVLFSCTSKCIVSLTAKGYFEDSPSKYRTVAQDLKIEATPKINPKPGAANSSDNITSGVGSANPLEDYAAFTKDDITLSGSGTIYGNVGSIGGKISLDGGAKITGSIAASDQSKLVYPSWMNGIREKYTKLPNITSTNTANPLEQFLPEFPEFQIANGNSIALPEDLEYAYSQWNKTKIIKNGGFYSDTWMTPNYTLTLKDDTRFTTFKLGNNNNLAIDIGNNDVNLYLEDLDIINGDVKITGNGQLNIFVKNKFTIDSQSIFDIGNNNVNLYVKDLDIKQGEVKFGSAGILNTYVTNSINIKGAFNKKGNPVSASIYYSGLNPVTFSAETQVYGSFYIKNSNLTLTGGAGFYGNLYSGGSKVEISGGVPSNGQWLVAPKADLYLYEGGNIIGTVISKTIISNGGTSITYGEPVVPNPTIPNTPSIPYSASTSSNLLLEGPLLEEDN